MSRTERLTVEVVVVLLAFLVPAFLLHTSPRFAGSLAGFVLGTSAAALMVALLIYPLAKYSARVSSLLSGVASKPALLAFHVYAGALGVFLAVLHTGHKYQSPLGVALLVMMLVVVATGVIGRYYLPQTSVELRDEQARLAVLRSTYDRIVAAAGEQAVSESVVLSGPAVYGVSIRDLVGGMADLEYVVGSREAIRKVFIRWIVAHVITSVVMYLLLFLHVAGELYYGLRWLGP